MDEGDSVARVSEFACERKDGVDGTELATTSGKG